MVTPRSGHAAVRLFDGRVLVVGGGNSDENDTSAELYDPDSGTWSAAGNMIRRRSGFPPTVLRDGSVLVGDDDGDERQGSELFDPVSGTWSATGKPVNRRGSTATLLRDGKVLVIGYDDTGELYDPVSGTWSATGKPVNRRGSTATLLRDGKVLVIGYDDTGELYDPVSGTWSATGKMTTPRHSHTALLLPDGKVLVAGGHAPGDEPTDAAELYDPDTGSWTAIANMHAERDAIEAFVLPNGKALVVGSSRGEPWSAELYDPAAGTWTARTALAATQVGYQTATVLSDGTVLVVGIARPEPDSPQQPCSAPALFDPRTGSLTPASRMLWCGYGSSFTPLLDGTVLVAGGRDCNGDGVCVSTGSAELYVPRGVSPPPLPAFPSPSPAIIPSPTPRPTPLPPADGPVPPNARSWKVTVDNKSSEPATLFVAEVDEGSFRLVGSATPNVVPAGATVEVTFRFPATEDGWIYVNPRPGEGGSLVHAADIGIPGKILITADGQVGWLSP
jgi:deoxycytidylate deaminase